MRAERVGSETMLAQIVRMVGEAQRNASADPASRRPSSRPTSFRPCCWSPLLTFVVWALFGPEPRMAHALVNAVAVLIIACPCALGLATPMSIMVGTGRGATAGVLIKNAEALEMLEKVDTLVVDKTGTLTEGKPRLVTVVPRPARTRRSSLRLAASLERGSEHPLAAAIAKGADERGSEAARCRGVRVAHRHRACRGPSTASAVAIGNLKLARKTLGIDPGELAGRAETLRADGQTVIFIAIDGRAAGLLGDRRPDQGIAPPMRSKRSTTRACGSSCSRATAGRRRKPSRESSGSTRSGPKCFPSRKAEVVKRLQAEGTRRRDGG